jgi:hypothetical protein
MQSQTKWTILLVIFAKLVMWCIKLAAGLAWIALCLLADLIRIMFGLARRGIASAIERHAASREIRAALDRADRARIHALATAQRKAWLDTCRTVCTWRDGMLSYRLMRPDGLQAASIAFRGSVPACETVTETEHADAVQDWLDDVTRKVCKPVMVAKGKRKAGRPKRIRM